MHSFVSTDSFTKRDTVLQMARCSFDIHVQDIIGSLIIGATLIMLRPRGNIDFDYLKEVLIEKQTSYVHTVPSLLHSFFTFLKSTNNWNVASCFRQICSGGE
jgi:non-ribosomal peptide synthetase component F